MNTKQDEALSMERAFSVVDTLKLALDYIVATNKSSQFWLVPESNLNRTVTAIREALALVNKVDQEQPALEQEIEELTAQRDKLADILTRTANALKGQPAELSLHSWHDLPEVAQQLKAAQQHEPYGWKVYGVNSLFMGEFAEADAKAEAKRIGGTCITFPLYTSPPVSKPWVGLTDEEKMAALVSVDAETKRLPPGFRNFAHAIEAKLKEKNNG